MLQVSMCHADVTVKASVRSLMHIIGSCTLTQSMCWPAYEIPLGLSSLLHVSPLSLLTYSSVHLILSFLLHWGKRNLLLTYLLLPNDGQLCDEDYFFTCDREDYPVVTLAFLGQKMGTKEERCPIHEVGDQLMLLPENVLEVWRDVNHSHSYSLLPPSLSFSLFLYLAAFRAHSKHFWDPGHLPFSHLLPLFVRESLFVQTTWGLTEIGRRHLHCLTELRHFLIAPKSHGKG